MRSKIFFLGLLLSACTLAPAQGIKSKLRQGNSLYKAKNFPEAETTYRKALLLDSLSGKANFGIAASAYEQGRYEESSRYLERALKDTRLTPAQASATRKMIVSKNKTTSRTNSHPSRSRTRIRTSRSSPLSKATISKDKLLIRRINR